jgi:type IV pilus assembly protein PilX
MKNMQTQRGAALATSLILLLVLTIIGVSAMQMTRMQERMAGNSRDVNLALQGAEAALRDGEKWLGSLNDTPGTCAAPPCEVYQFNVLPSIEDSDQKWWADNGREYGAAGKDELTRDAGGELEEEPAYVVEVIGFDADGVLYGAPGREFYQVTARSTGGSGKANVIVQSTYARRN